MLEWLLLALGAAWYLGRASGFRPVSQNLAVDCYSQKFNVLLDAQSDKA